MSNINPLLASLPNWGVAHMNLKADGKPSKAPVTSTRFSYCLNELTVDKRYFSLQDAREWLAHVTSYGNKAALAFGLVREDNILCVDIDFKGMGHSKKDLDFILKTIIAKCGTFWEYSASMEGLHLYYIVSPDLELNYAQFGIGEYNENGKVIKGEIGLYMDKRYIVQVDAPSGGEIAELNSYGLQAVATANSRPKIDYNAVVGDANCSQAEFDKALESAKKSKHWWPGQDTGDGMSDNSHSAGDMALFKHIAIQVNFNWQAALAIFQQSPRYTSERIAKKNVNRDYFADEAKKACISRFQEEATKTLIMSSVQLNLELPKVAVTIEQPTTSPIAVPAKVAYKDDETGVVLALDSAFHLPAGLEEVKFKPTMVNGTSPPTVPLPINKTKKDVIRQDVWPPLRDGTLNPSNVDYESPEGFIRFVTSHDDDLLVVKIAKVLMARMPSVATSVDTCLLNSLLLLSAIIGPKAKNAKDTEPGSIFATPRVINVGETGTGKTVLAIAMQNVLSALPADAKPSYHSGIPVSGQAVHDKLSKSATGNGLLWYLPEVADLLMADSSDAQRRNPHLFLANQTLLISAADSSTYGTPLPAMEGVTKPRPEVQGVYVTTFGDCTKEVFTSIFDTSATRGTTNRGIFNLMSPKIQAWSDKLDNETPARCRELSAMLADCQTVRDDVVNKLAALGRGELVPGLRYNRLDPLIIYLASPSDQPPRVEKLLLDVKQTETLNINARAIQHIRSLLQTVAVCDPVYDKQLDRFCINPDIAELVIGLVLRAGQALSNEGGLLTAEHSTSDKIQDAIVSSIKKKIEKGLPAIHMNKYAEFVKGFITKSMATYGMQNHPSMASASNKGLTLSNALRDLAEDGYYLTEVLPTEKAMNGLSANGSWYKMNLDAFNKL